ncbi:MAG: peptide chain release factor aRF-1 [Candidatus Aenigmarchaeota archaeon]|nr:peptide chain release factor aRF-1 [Candidatus Aenigmarchaeota archaeon]
MTDKTQYKLKKLIKLLESKKGRHTELVSVYVPAGYSLHEVSNQLKQEQSTAANIKSKPVRKNVLTALEKIQRHLTLYKRTPENGLAVFCGNVSEKEGWADIELWAIEPPEKIKTKLYWCDQSFVLDPLKEMVKEKEVYGIILLDRSEANIAILRGKKIQPVVHFDSIVPGKTRAGGQSSARFSRVREGMLHDWFKQVGEAANKIFQEQKDVIGIIISGPGPNKEHFFKGDFLLTEVKKKVLGIVDTSYTGDYGLKETIERSEDILKEASVTKEKKLLKRFFSELERGNLAVYGIKETINALKMGAVDTVIISENSDYIEVELECSCGIEKKIIREGEKKKIICPKCNQLKQIVGQRDIEEFFEEHAKDYGTKIELVSTDTREGEQFYQLGGIGGILRYKIE